MKHHIKIDNDAMAVLRRSTITDDSLMLPDERLERGLYERVNKVLVTAGGKWTGKLGKGGRHVFTRDPREVLGIAMETGAIKDAKKATQAFFTPPAFARRVIQQASVSGKTVPEPSAGYGALAKAAAEAGAASVICVESDPDSAAHLRNLGFSQVEEIDFLTMQPEPVHRVVMNPPFTAGQDVDHVTHAFSFLKPGGRLVAIMSPGWETKTDKRSSRFRDLLAEHGRIAERINAGEFKESGTMIATLMVVIDKP